MTNTWEQKTTDEHPPQIRLDKGRVGWWYTIERWVEAAYWADGTPRGNEGYDSDRDYADGWRWSRSCAEQAARARLCRQDRAAREQRERNAQTETIEVYR